MAKNYCGFCGKAEDEVGRLIAGPSIFICDECVELMHGMLTGPVRPHSRPYAEFRADVLKRLREKQ